MSTNKRDRHIKISRQLQTDWSIVGVEGSTVFVKLCGGAGSGLLRFSQRFPVKVGLIFKTKLLCAVSTAASGR